MIETSYLLEYWATTPDKARFKNTMEFDKDHHKDFTKACLLTIKNGSYISNSIRLKYTNEDWYKSLDEELAIEYDRNRLIKEE